MIPDVSSHTFYSSSSHSHVHLLISEQLPIIVFCWFGEYRCRRTRFKIFHWWLVHYNVVLTSSLHPFNAVPALMLPFAVVSRFGCKPSFHWLFLLQPAGLSYAHAHSILLSQYGNDFVGGKNKGQRHASLRVCKWADAFIWNALNSLQLFA